MNRVEMHDVKDTKIKSKVYKKSMSQCGREVKVQELEETGHLVPSVRN